MSRRKCALHLGVFAAVGASFSDYRAEKFVSELKKRFKDSDYFVIEANLVTPEALIQLETQEEKRVVLVHSL